MIKLYDFELSGSCYKIRMFLNILGQQYESVTVDFVNKEHKTGFCRNSAMELSMATRTTPIRKPARKIGWLPTRLGLGPRRAGLCGSCA